MSSELHTLTLTAQPQKRSWVSIWDYPEVYLEGELKVKKPPRTVPQAVREFAQQRANPRLFRISSPHCTKTVFLVNRIVQLYHKATLICYKGSFYMLARGEPKKKVNRHTVDHYAAIHEFIQRELVESGQLKLVEWQLDKELEYERKRIERQGEDPW